MIKYKENLITVSGVPEGLDAQILVDYLRDTRAPIIYIARDDKRQEAMRNALAFFAPELPVFSLPAWDCMPYDRISPNSNIVAQRISVLAMLAQGIEYPFILLTTLAGVSQYLPKPQLIKKASFTAQAGRIIDVDALREYFLHMGFSQTSRVSEPGDFAFRGGIIDVFPSGAKGPVRLDLFGDELETVRRFDPVSQKTVEKLDRVEFAPVCEVILDQPAIKRFRNAYRRVFGVARKEDPLYEAISAGRKHQGFEHWMPFFYDEMASLFEYVPHAMVCYDEAVDHVHLARWNNICNQYSARQEALNTKTSNDIVYQPIPPELLYLSPEVFEQVVSAHKQRKFNVLSLPTGPNVIDMSGRIGRNFIQERQDAQINLFKVFSEYVRKISEKQAVVIASFSKGSRERLKSVLLDYDVLNTHLCAGFSDLTLKAGFISLVVWPLDKGYEIDGLTVISEQDILGDRMVRGARKRRRAADFLTETTSISLDDLVVHVDHGVGRYCGLKTLTVSGVPHDCLQLEYANNDRLYVPVENIELLSRFGYDTGMLDRLGGVAWQAKKRRLKERVHQMADKLIRIAAERALRKAHVMTPPDDQWDAFCAGFPYTETDDQLSAIDEVLHDMASGRPMDRLICGDVGFGKTEVALRASFIAAASGTQVAVIAPTTLLARQHFELFEKRFRGTGICVRHLSRFVSANQMKSTRNALADGSVEIVVGTHALLAKDIQFFNLGLLIIDEEQKFGVEHKEQLKHLRSDVHVLTLSATPIPRTLQMSLAGVRELSLIATPPVDRLAIRTYVSEFDTITIREALLREHYRGGQSFFVVPRVADLPDIEHFLSQHLPELSYVIAHGQMASSDLDRRMSDFYGGKYDILLATTIIESGLDIPSANTVVIYRADMFGLAQLYQIRGRVGRSKTRAYAYLTTKPRTPLTPTATKRLRVLGSLDTLGSAFNLASHDLDIRGAGDLLGEEQSGNIREIGYELYQEMLEEAIAKMRSGDTALLDNHGSWSPQINLGVPVQIPATYVGDLDVRLGLYRRLSSLGKKIELEGFAAELIDRFGALPPEVEMLLRVIRIKAMCYAAGIAKLDAGARGAVVQFYQDKFSNIEGLADYLSKSKGTAKMKDNKIIIRRDWDNDDKKIKGAYIIARDFARYAKNNS